MSIIRRYERMAEAINGCSTKVRHEVIAEKAGVEFEDFKSWVTSQMKDNDLREISDPECPSWIEKRTVWHYRDMPIVSNGLRETWKFDEPTPLSDPTKSHIVADLVKNALIPMDPPSKDLLNPKKYTCRRAFQSEGFSKCH